MESMNERPISLPIDKHCGAHGAVEADAGDVGPYGEPKFVFCSIDTHKFIDLPSSRLRRLPTTIFLAAESVQTEFLQKQQVVSKLSVWSTFNFLLNTVHWLTNFNRVSERNFPISAAVMNIKGIPIRAKITEKIFPKSVSTETSP